MGRPISKTELHPEYLEINKKSKEAKENNDCAIKAIALVTGTEYETVKEIAAKYGRRKRRGTHIHTIVHTLSELGFKLKGCNSRDYIKQYPSINSSLRNVTTHHPRRFPEVWKDGKVYLLFTKGHVSACVDGMVLDYTINKSKHVYSIREVVRK